MILILPSSCTLIKSKCLYKPYSVNFNIHRYQTYSGLSTFIFKILWEFVIWEQWCKSFQIANDSQRRKLCYIFLVKLTFDLRWAPAGSPSRHPQRPPWPPVHPGYPCPLVGSAWPMYRATGWRRWIQSPTEEQQARWDINKIHTCVLQLWLNKQCNCFTTLRE